MSVKIIDLYYKTNVGSNGFHEMAASGLIGILHKASQGDSFVDPKYADREARARSVGLLWGAFHFLTEEASVADQVDHFLSLVNPETTLLAVDYEKNPNTGTTPSLDQARNFVSGVFAKIGRYPVFYSGGTAKDALGGNVDPILGKCPLWLAQYGPNAVVQRTWTQWTLWQYADHGTVPGVTGDPDLDRFNGDDAALRAWWIGQIGIHGHVSASDGN